MLERRVNIYTSIETNQLTDFKSNGTFHMFQQCIVSSPFEIQKSVARFQ